LPFVAIFIECATHLVTFAWKKCLDFAWSPLLGQNNKVQQSFSPPCRTHLFDVWIPAGDARVRYPRQVADFYADLSGGWWVEEQGLNMDWTVVEEGEGEGYPEWVRG
jgi:hypothetical protein